MKKNILSMFDYLLLFIVFFLVIIGIFCIYSSGINAEGFLVTNEYQKQIIWAVIGFIFMILVTVYDFRKLEKKSIYLFILLIFLLLYTLFLGKYVNGARSWIGIGSVGIQVSEFGKIIFILFFAAFLDKTIGMNELKRYTLSIVLLFIPIALILLQPDYSIR